MKGEEAIAVFAEAISTGFLMLTCSKMSLRGGSGGLRGASFPRSTAAAPGEVFGRGAGAEVGPGVPGWWPHGVLAHRRLQGVRALREPHGEGLPPCRAS